MNKNSKMDDLSPEEKRALLKQLLLKKTAKQKTHPLSYNQQRLWLLYRINPDNPAYNMHQAYQIQGSLNKVVFQKALNEICARHDSFRTTFREENGNAVQIIAPNTQSKMKEVDLCLETNPMEAAKKYAIVENRRAYDLTDGPLHSFHLVKIGQDNYIFLLFMHHLITDLWSFSIFNKELSTLYKSLHRGGEGLDALPMQYKEYAAWEHQAKNFKDGLAYWTEHLSNLDITEIPTDRPRGATPALKGATHRFPLNEAHIAEMKKQADLARLSVPMAWMALFQVLLYHHTGITDVSCATPVANRDRMEAQDVIGFFVNTLVLRTDFSGNPSFKEVLARFRQVSRALYSHSDTPFDFIVRQLQPSGDMSRNPLYEMMFQFGAMPELELDGLQCDCVFEMDCGVVRSDMEFYVNNKPGSACGLLVYDSALFHRETMVNLGERFQKLLATVVSRPNLGIDQFDLLGKRERSLLLDAWNNTEKPYSQNRCMHHLFEEQALKTPEMPATVCGDRSISYKALNERANRLAHYLISRGAGPEKLIGICAYRSLDMVVGVLAILKAGAAYVPMDEDYPVDRIRYILEDTKAETLITHSKILEGLGEISAHAVAMDQFSDTAYSVENPKTVLSSKNMAYIIFTSGSTGRPKGVIIRHHTVINLIEWVNRTYAVGPNDTLLFTTSLCFDLSVYDIFGTLACGAVVRVALKEELNDPRRLVEILNKEITFWDSAPAALQQLTPFFSDPGQGSKRLRLVFLSGDWIPLSLPPAVTTSFPNARVISLGGATEATIWSNFYPVKSMDPDWKSVPYGNPIQNAQYYVLNQGLSPTPINVPGNLFIGGNDCLSYGYFKQPRLTAERYIPDPFSSKPGSFIYTTGDCARWRPQGYMEFLGRRDTQVKIRGFRIELGEIESVLRSHEDVAEGIVLAREDKPGEKRLVAYIQSHSGNELSLRDVGNHLSERLPDYMIPSARVMVVQWPVTSNGKLDRKGLPAPNTMEDQVLYEAPREPVEEELCEIWEEVLGVGRVGIRDNFFNLGGHSLMAVRMVARLQKIYEVDLSIRSLFASPTVAELAESIHDLRTAGPTQQTTITRQDTPCKLLSAAQERLWYFDQLMPGSCVYNLPRAVRLRGALNTPALEAALNRIVARHESLRCRFPIVDGQPVAQIEDPSVFSMSFEDISEHPDNAREALTLHHAQENLEFSFNLENEIGFRASLLRLSDQEHVLLLCMHHIVSDGWSAEILIMELNAIYAALCANKEPNLPELSIRYTDYVAWEHHPDRKAEKAEELAWWVKTLEGEPPVLQLPSDRPRPSDFRFRGRDHFFELSRHQMSRIHAQCEAEGVTSFMYLLTAMNILMYRYSGQEDLWTGCSLANRKRVEVEPVIGLFFNTLIMRVNMGGNPTVREALQRVRDGALGVYDHEETSFERLVEELSPERDLSHNPLFQVMFTHMQEAIPEINFPGLEVERIEAENRGAMFDLIFDLSEIPEPEDPIGLRARIEYNTDIFDKPTIVRMEQHYRLILESMLNHVGQKVNQLSMLTGTEKLIITGDWNDTEKPFQDHLCLHQLFERQVERNPNAVALSFGGETLSYDDLNRMANRLAHHLLERGVGPGHLIGVCIERSFQMVAGLLGILKTGAAYVPMDTKYPDDRIIHILNDIQAPCYLGQASIADRLKSVSTPCVQLDREDFEAYPNTNPTSTVDSNHLAYIIFTSGSTGRPKGVVLQHRPVVNLIEWVNNTHNVGPGDCLLFTTSLCFDLSVYDIFGSLAAGAIVRIASHDELSDATKLITILQNEPITFWDSAPAALLQLAPLFSKNGNPSLRLVFLSGDWIPLSLPSAVKNSFPNARVIGLGGATEAAIWSNFFPIETIKKEWRSIPYGRPIQNAVYLVLDASLNLCPINTPGDLYIGGDVLSRGYFKQPALSAQRYAPNPYSKKPGGILYNTGDRARLFSDGNIEFLGRLDSQVKIRGFRIELGEIESVLQNHPHVREAVVLARADRSGEKRLVAYVMPMKDESPQFKHLVEHLKRSLPEYMVPLAYVLMNSWPTTSNGKLDRKALPDPTGDELERTGYTPPRNEREKTLSDIIADTLGLERVGVFDNYFEVGGDSIKSIRVIARAQAQNIHITPRDFFLGQNVAGILEAARDAAPTTVLQSGDTPLRKLSANQHGLWIASQLNQKSAIYNVDFGLVLEGPLNSDLLSQAINTVAGSHEILHSVFVMEDGAPHRRIVPPSDIPFKYKDLKGNSQETIRQVIAEDVSKPFSLTQQPAIRAAVYQVGESVYQLVLSLHHLITDAASIQLLIGEMAQHYNSAMENVEANIPEPPQYNQFTQWQAAWLESSERHKHLLYWEKQLHRCPANSALPGDRSRKDAPSTAGHVLVQTMPKGLETLSVKLSAELNATLYTTLLSVFFIILRKGAKRDDLVVGADVSTRSLPQSLQMQGLFINQLPLRCQLQPEMTFAQLVAEVGKVVKDALAYQNLPFDQIVAASAVPREPGLPPLFQTKFGFHKIQEFPVFRNLKASMVEIPRDSTQIDINLNIMQTQKGLMYHLQYGTDLYNKETMINLLGHMEVILGLVARESTLTLTNLTRQLDEHIAAEKERVRNDHTAEQHSRLRKIKRKSFKIND